MQVKGSAMPEAAFIVEPRPKKPGYCIIRFRQNVQEVEPNLWRYDEYCLEMPYSDRIVQDVESNYAGMLEQAKAQELQSRQFDPQQQAQMEAQAKITAAQVTAQSDRTDFLEDCIAEMATIVYGGV